jgi:hypothetical protein
MLSKAGVYWMARFVRDVQDAFEASVWQAEHRQQRRIPSTETYQRMCDLGGAVRACFDLHQLVDGPPLPVEARSDPTLLQMVQLASRAICWSSDILGFESALRRGDCHNLVIVLARSSGGDLHDGLRCAARLHDAAVRTFMRLEARLAVQTLPPSPEVRSFVAALKCWIRAHFEWAVATQATASSGS